MGAWETSGGGLGYLMNMIETPCKHRTNALNVFYTQLLGHKFSYFN